MKNTIIFLGVIITALLTWFGYALLASVITDTTLNNCLSDGTVIVLFLFTGWIVPALVGYDLYKYIHRHEIRRNKRIDKEIHEIKTNTFGAGKRHAHGNLLSQLNLN